MEQDLVALLLTQAPLVAIAVVVLYWKMERMGRRLERRMDRLERGVERMEVQFSRRFDRLEENVFTLVKFGEKLLSVLTARGVVTDVEADVLRGYLELPASRSRYYTKEVEARLRELLRKRMEEYTWDDLLEMRRLAELVEKEADETEDREYARELWRFLADFRVFLAVLEGRLIAKGKAPRPSAES